MKSNGPHAQHGIKNGMLRRVQPHLFRNREDISLALKIEAVWRALLALNMCMRNAAIKHLLRKWW